MMRNETPRALATTRRAEAIREETGLSWETCCALAEHEREASRPPLGSSRGLLPVSLAYAVREHNARQDTLGACYVPPVNVRWPL